MHTLIEMASFYSAAFYTNFAVQNTSFSRNGDVSASVAWIVTCMLNGFQETFSTVYTIPSSGMTDQEVKEDAFESISYQILPWSNQVIGQPPMTLGATGTYVLGNLYVDGSTNRVGVGTTNPSDTLQIQGNCNLQGTAYKIGGANVLTATTLGSSITSSSLTTLGTLSAPMNLASGQAYRINNQDVLSATTLGSGVTGSSLQNVGTLSSLSTTGNVQFNRAGTTSTNFEYNATSNVMTFGAGNTGGHFQVIGTFVQGVTGTTGQAGNAKFGYRNPGQFVEIGADSANNAYVDFHSNISHDIDYDTRILSIGGTATNNGKGEMRMYARNFRLESVTDRSDPKIQSLQNFSYLPGNIMVTDFPPRDRIVDEYVMSGVVSANTSTVTWAFPTVNVNGEGYRHYQIFCSASNNSGNWNYYFGNAFGSGASVIYAPANTAGSSPQLVFGNAGATPQFRVNNNTNGAVQWILRLYCIAY